MLWIIINRSSIYSPCQVYSIHCVITPISTRFDLKQNCEVGGLCLWALFASSIRRSLFLPPGNTSVLFSLILSQLIVNWLLLILVHQVPIGLLHPQTSQELALNHFAPQASVQPLPLSLQNNMKGSGMKQLIQMASSLCHYVILLYASTKLCIWLCLYDL